MYMKYTQQGSALPIPHTHDMMSACPTCLYTHPVHVRRTLRSPPPAPLRSLFWAAGFSFGPAAWLSDAGYDAPLPHLFFGEEAYVHTRLATRGWQVYAPSTPLLFTQWERCARAFSYQSSGAIDSVARAASLQRVRAVLHGDKAEERGCDADWAPGGRWGLGTCCSLAQHEEACGVTFATHTIQQHARWGGLQPAAFASDGDGDELVPPDA